MIYEHACTDCKHFSKDTERLFVCPDCSSSEISNVEATQKEAEEIDYDEKELDGEVLGEAEFFNTTLDDIEGDLDL